MKNLPKAIVRQVVADLLVGTMPRRLEAARWMNSGRAIEVCRDAGVDRAVLLRVCATTAGMTDAERRGMWARMKMRFHTKVVENKRHVQA